MSNLLLNRKGRIALQVCAATAMAALMSGCSADSTRLGDPFGNPFSSASNDTPTAPRRHVAASDVIPVGRTPPVSSASLAPRAVASAALPAPRTGSSVAFRDPISRETTGSIEPASARSVSVASAGGWTTAGGTPIQVSEGETAAVLASRYGVPTASLLQVNGLRSAADVRPGTRLVIPVYGSAPAASRVAAVAPRAVEPPPAVETRVRPVEARVAEAKPAHAAREQLLTPPARTAAATPRAAVPVARLAAAEPRQVRQIETATPGKHVRPGAAALRAAPAQVAEEAEEPAVKAAPAKVAQVKAVPVKAAPVAKTVAVAAAKATPVETTKVAAAPQPAAEPVATQPQQTAAPDSSPEFRWPARGRIIQSFKGGSSGNDGINIALPEGTSVKAAEGGVVAYAGSELKGYGNLVLIRHPNGFVSAYANNGEIEVKRGDTVKRGQQIAKSGQSGNVSSPQLHFELRKGSTPVDPTQYLAGL